MSESDVVEDELMTGLAEERPPSDDEDVQEVSSDDSEEDQTMNTSASSGKQKTHAVQLYLMTDNPLFSSSTLHNATINLQKHNSFKNSCIKCLAVLIPRK